MASTMLSWLGFAIGLLIWCGVLWDGFATIVLPRTVAPMRRFSGRFYKWSWWLWSVMGRRIRDRDLSLSFLAVYGPVSVMFLLVLCGDGVLAAQARIAYRMGLRLLEDLTAVLALRPIATVGFV